MEISHDFDYSTDIVTKRASDVWAMIVVNEWVFELAVSAFLKVDTRGWGDVQNQTVSIFG